MGVVDTFKVIQINHGKPQRRFFSGRQRSIQTGNQCAAIGRMRQGVGFGQFLITVPGCHGLHDQAQESCIEAAAQQGRADQEHIKQRRMVDANSRQVHLPHDQPDQRRRSDVINELDEEYAHSCDEQGGDHQPPHRCFHAHAFDLFIEQKGQRCHVNDAEQTPRQHAPAIGRDNNRQRCPRQRAADEYIQ